MWCTDGNLSNAHHHTATFNTHIQLIESTMCSYFDALTVTRLNHAANMCHSALGVCVPSLHQVLNWGPHKGGKDDASDIVYVGEGKLTVVIVAEFKGTLCYTSQGIELINSASASLPWSQKTLPSWSAS